MIKSKLIPWQPFSPLHKEYIKNCLTNTFNFAEGAVRSGKTISNVYAFAMLLERTPDKLHLATGTSLAAACMNIGDCNGFGLEHIFRGRSRWGLYKGNKALYITTKKGLERVIIFVGGGKSDSYKKIRGNSFGMWIASEVNKHFISDDDHCFLSEAFNRLLASGMRRILWDFNPDYPTHPIYTKYVDKYLADGLDVNHRKFTIFDNNAISPERIAEITKQYIPGSFWYKRCILGERAAAEGVIFKNFVQNPERWIRKEPPEDIHHVVMGIDYGGNMSASAFTAVGIRKSMSGLCVMKDKKVSGKKGEISPQDIEKEFISFYREFEKDFPNLPVQYIFADSEAQYLTNGLRRACKAAGIKTGISDSKKVNIAERISCKSRLMAEDKWCVLKSCKNVIASTSTQLWDPNHPDRRLDNGTCDIDTADAEEYAWEHFIKQLTLTK